MKINIFDDIRKYHATKDLQGRLKKRGHDVTIYKKFDGKVVNNCDVAWIDGLTNNARMASNFNGLKVPLVVRLCTMELYKQNTSYFNWNRIDKLLVLSKHLKDYFLERWKKLDKKDIEVMYGGIDMKRFKMGDKKKTNKVAIVSGIHWRKGIQLIPEIIKRLGSDFMFYHIGRITNWDAKNYLDWKLKKYGVKQYYSYDGEIGYKSVPSWLKDKTYLLHPSYTDGFGLAVAEGMSVGLMPLVHDYRGAVDLWGEENVWDEVSEVSDMIKRKYLPDKYRDYVKQNYSLERQVDKAEAVCKELI